MTQFYAEPYPRVSVGVHVRAVGWAKAESDAGEASGGA